jgi:hypothetical protein
MKAQRIRCYVNVPGLDKDVYLFISDVERVTEVADEGISVHGDLEVERIEPETYDLGETETTAAEDEDLVTEVNVDDPQAEDEAVAV